MYIFIIWDSTILTYMFRAIPCYISYYLWLIRNIHRWYFAYLYCQLTLWIISALFTAGNRVTEIIGGTSWNKLSFSLERLSLRASLWSHLRASSRNPRTNSVNASLKFFISRTTLSTKIICICQDSSEKQNK